jgi:MauM/NapG family ferredoxin protein
LDRRDFFRAGIKKVTNTVVNEIDARVEQKAKRYIRPPYAIKEVEFLLACSRCDDCIDACPHDVLFKLSAKLGADVVGTPAMALLSKGCHLCDDWPCVTACTTDALKLPQADDEESRAEEYEPPLPRLARVNIDEETCLPFKGPECGACVPVCPVAGALILNLEKPYIIPELCTGCALCREACILEQKAITIASL